MYATQRIAKIKELLLQNKIVNVTTLTEVLRVSDVTVRKDLDKLATEGFLAKIHGGAVLLENEVNKTSEPVSIPNPSTKELVARTAISLIDPKDAIFIGPGTTCYMMHSFLKKMPEVTVVTNNVSLSLEINRYVKKVFVLSGELCELRGLYHTQPYNSESGLEGFFVNKAFISCEGVDLEGGIAYSGILDYSFLKMIPQLCKQTHLMVERNKFNKIDLYSIGDISTISCVITDDCDDPRYHAYLAKNKIKFVIANQI